MRRCATEIYTFFLFEKQRILGVYFDLNFMLKNMTISEKRIIVRSQALRP